MSTKSTKDPNGTNAHDPTPVVSPDLREKLLHDVISDDILEERVNAFLVVNEAAIRKDLGGIPLEAARPVLRGVAYASLKLMLKVAEASGGRRAVRDMLDLLNDANEDLLKDILANRLAARMAEAKHPPTPAPANPARANGSGAAEDQDLVQRVAHAVRTLAQPQDPAYG